MTAAEEVERDARIVGGVDDLEVRADVHGIAFNATNSATVGVGVGLNSTNTNSAQILRGVQCNSGLTRVNCEAKYKGTPAIGWNSFVWLEISQAVGTTTWSGDQGLTYWQTGLDGWVWC